MKIEFWDRVRHGAQILGVPDETYRTWKFRGRVSRERIIDLYEVLAGSKYEVSLSELNKSQKTR